MELVFLGLGSNVGDSGRLIKEAFAELSSCLGSPRLSGLWRSKARYVTNQPDFINAVASGYCGLSARELLEEVHRVEARFGRDRSREQVKGPRSLDIDILLYGEKLFAEPDLIIPHAGLGERKFALLPLLELEPGLRNPHTGEPLLLSLSRLPPQGIYLLGIDRYDSLYI